MRVRRDLAAIATGFAFSVALGPVPAAHTQTVPDAPYWLIILTPPKNVALNQLIETREDCKRGETWVNSHHGSGYDALCLPAGHLPEKLK